MYSESFIPQIEAILEKLKLEESLPTSYLISLLDLGYIGWWLWDIESGYDYLSKGWCKILGYKQNELVHHVSTWKNLMHPEDRIKAQIAMNLHLREGKNYSLIARYQHREGHYVTLEDTGKVISFDENLNPLIMVGFEKLVKDE